jgi:hypothetical protein
MAMEVLLIDVAWDLHVCFTKRRQFIYLHHSYFQELTWKLFVVAFVTVAQFLNAKTLKGWKFKSLHTVGCRISTCLLVIVVSGDYASYPRTLTKLEQIREEIAAVLMEVIWYLMGYLSEYSSIYDGYHSWKMNIVYKVMWNGHFVENRESVGAPPPPPKQRFLCH